MGIMMADTTVCSITDKLSTQLSQMGPVLRGFATCEM